MRTVRADNYLRPQASREASGKPQCSIIEICARRGKNSNPGASRTAGKVAIEGATVQNPARHRKLLALSGRRIDAL
jgi:hypothetical protein